MMNTPLEQRSVLFITLDSCRYDSVAAANTPNLDKLGPVRAAGTHGTYTFPAHMSFFMGYLPSVASPPFEPYYSAEIKQLWRLSSGRARTPDTVGIAIDGITVPQTYANRGFHVVGTGGVRWFRHPLLTSQFSQFHFYGKNDYSSVFTEREESEFALNHVDEIIDEIGDKNFFWFINCQETHVPYNTGATPLTEKAHEIIKKYQKIWGFKGADAEKVAICEEDFRYLHQLQISAVEELDKKIGQLIARINKPLLVVIAGDHGECFGEDGAWGHGYPHPKVHEVPLLIATVN